MALMLLRLPGSLLRRVLPESWYGICRLAYDLTRSLAHESRVFGLSAAVILFFADLSFRLQRNSRPSTSRRTSLVRIRVKGLPHPLYFRPRTSDIFTIRQIFSERQYGPATGIDSPAIILDCGANIGCASVFFLASWPTARVIAIEPDRSNADVCRRNLQGYADRVQVIQAALWPRADRLRMVRGEGRDSLPWSHQVAPAGVDGMSDVRTVTVAEVMRTAGLDSIDLMKIDIEGAERHLFAENQEPWLARTSNIAIELHDAECEERLLGALVPFRYRIERAGELTFIWDIARDTK